MKSSLQPSLAVAAAVLACLTSLNGQVVVTTNRIASGFSTTGTFVFPANTVPSNSALDLVNGKSFTVLAGTPSASGPISNLTNGTAQTNQDSVGQSFFANGINAADGSALIRIQIDLETVHNIERISSYSWHVNSRAPQLYSVYGATTPSNNAPDFTAAAFRNDTALATLGYTRIAEVKTATASGGQYGATVTGTIGQYRYLLFDLAPVNATTPRPTFYGEIDIYGAPAAITPFTLSIAPAVSPQTGFDLKWNSKSTKSYRLRTSTDLATPISQWNVVEQNIPPTAPLNNYNIAPSGPSRFYAVEETAGLPLINANFEGNNGGFTATSTAGSVWEYGTPTSGSSGTPNLGGFVSAGAQDSANCWGINIGNPGFYLPNTVTRLRSPVINLTTVAAANLNFFQATDFSNQDVAVVNIIDDTTDTIIAAAIYTASDPDQNTAAWASVGPISLAAGLGQPVRIEWVFSGTNQTDYMGWYIDNVTVNQGP